MGEGGKADRKDKKGRKPGKTSKSYLTGSEKGDRNKRSRYKKSTYSTKRVYRTLYGLGIGLVLLAFIMSCMAHSNNIVVCAFGYVDPKGALVATFFKEDLSNYQVERLEPFVWSYGLWTHCVNNRCTAIVNVDDSEPKEGEGGSLEYSKLTIEKKFEKFGENLAAKAWLIISHVVALALIAYFIAALVKVIQNKIALIVTACVMFVTLLVACAIFTDWILVNADPYGGYCQG